MTSIALVVLDTLRKDAFDAYFDWMPGIRYENAWSTSNWTIPSHASLFTGRYASEIGVYAGREELNCSDPTLAELLSDHGYTTRLFSANPLISSSFSFDRGFEKTHGSWRFDALQPNLFDWKTAFQETNSPYSFPKALMKCLFDTHSELIPSLKHGIEIKRTEDDGAKKSLEYVKENDFGDDEFLFMNLMEAHAPYSPPEEYQTVTLSSADDLRLRMFDETDHDPTPEKTAYKDGVNYLSDMYEKIFIQLQDDFEYIITTADHGELFGEHGVWAHVHGLYPELMNVPLVIYNNENTDSVCKKPVSLLDVHQTILEMGGVNHRTEPRGQNLLTDIDDKSFLTEFLGLRPKAKQNLSTNISAKTLNKYDKWLRGIVSHPSYYGYETYSGEFVETSDHTSHVGKQELKAAAEQLPVQELTGDGKERNLSPSTKRQLEELGYI